MSRKTSEMQINADECQIADECQMDSIKAKNAEHASFRITLLSHLLPDER